MSIMTSREGMLAFTRHLLRSPRDAASSTAESKTATSDESHDTSATETVQRPTVVVPPLASSEEAEEASSKEATSEESKPTFRQMRAFAKQKPTGESKAKAKTTAKDDDVEKGVQFASFLKPTFQDEFIHQAMKQFQPLDPVDELTEDQLRWIAGLLQKASHQFRVISIEGGIACGKSTLLDILKTELEALGLNVCVIPEPSAEWEKDGMLAEFYSDMVGNAYIFQTYVTETRIRACENAIAKNPNADIYICERCLLTDRIFMALQWDKLSANTRSCYVRWWNLLYPRLSPFDLHRAVIVLLGPSIKECQKRLRTRGREAEKRKTEKTSTQTAKTEAETETKIQSPTEAKTAKTALALETDGTDDNITKTKIETSADQSTEGGTLALEPDTKPATLIATKSLDDDESDLAVKSSYQRDLMDAMMFYFAGKPHAALEKHMPRFPGNPEQVNLIGPEILDHDYRQKGSDARTALVGRFVKIITKSWPELGNKIKST